MPASITDLAVEGLPRGQSGVETEKGSEVQCTNIKPDIEYPHGLAFFMLTVGLMAVVLIIALDNYIIATAVPRLTTEFKDLSLVGWYGSSYFLTLMAFQPAFGQLCTIFPVKNIYLASIVVFEAGSAISASAPTAVAFIVGRLISGAAGGGLWCGTLTLMGYAVPVNKRHLYVSIVTSMYGVASAAGPLLGGVFTDSPKLRWRFCFWVNIPIGFVAFVIVSIYLRPPPPTHLAASLTLYQKLARLDVIGALMLIAAFVCLILALQWGGTTFAWSDPRVWGCLLGFGLIISSFVILQIWLKDRATVPSRILSKPTATIGCLFTILLTMAIGVHVYYLPFYFQSVLGVTAQESGIRTLPYLMALLISPMISGALITVVGYYVPFMWVGSTLLTIGSGLLFTLGTDSTPGQWIGYQFLAAFGAGICRQIAFSAVPLVFDKDDLATASALVAFCNSLGPTLAICVGQSIFTNKFMQKVALIPDIDATTVVNGGAYNLGALVPTQLLEPVRQAFGYALTRAFVLSIGSSGAAFFSSLAMEWIDVRAHHQQ